MRREIPKRNKTLRSDPASPSGVISPRNATKSPVSSPRAVITKQPESNPTTEKENEMEQKEQEKEQPPKEREEGLGTRTTSYEGIELKRLGMPVVSEIKSPSQQMNVKLTVAELKCSCTDKIKCRQCGLMVLSCCIEVT